ncbi:uncharacterized protein FIBRA_03175 [Fibroporia radiculosa]|uniref:Uncharacterized protein n=1 Tax=Fibroporia radiculosa TaxID=599839 RepID=J4HVU6_9APHY|nr:uncharacterized protein FIBRA_03175 [Fibroporia radiculosa]CCM01127.1 predicted protein [Fibroporia radiculosa]
MRAQAQQRHRDLSRFLLVSSRTPVAQAYPAANHVPAGRVPCRQGSPPRRGKKIMAAASRGRILRESLARPLRACAIPPLLIRIPSPQLSPVPVDEDAGFVADDDPLDGLSDDAPGLGVLVRTDFANEDAWHAFCSSLQGAEAEFVSERPSEDASTRDAPRASPTAADDDAMDEDSNSDDDEDPEAEPGPIIFVLDAGPADRARFANISNLTALRLLNDVDVRRAPAVPAGTRRIRPPNRLVDHDGWQEVYTGKTIWIYDAKSNSDQCARLVSQHGGPYGTATGDSWRARVSHLCELQVNLASGAMSINFGEQDRWDHDERVRNMADAIR